MKLVQLKLRTSCPFWSLPPVFLNKEQNSSPWIDVELLTEKQKEVINKSIYQHEILLFDSDNNRVHGSLEEVSSVNGNYVNDDDIEVEEDVLPEIGAVTVEENILEEVDEEPEELQIEDDSKPASGLSQDAQFNPRQMEGIS